jgi:hypothetical protein
LELVFQIPEKEDITWGISREYGGYGIWSILNSLILAIDPFAA